MPSSTIQTVHDINTENVKTLGDVVRVLDVLSEALGEDGIPGIQKCLAELKNNIVAMQSCYNPMSLIALLKAQADIVVVLQNSILECPLNDSTRNDIQICKDLLINFKMIMANFKQNPSSYFPYLVRPIVDGLLSSSWFHQRFQSNIESITDCVNALEHTVDWKIGLQDNSPNAQQFKNLLSQILSDLNTDIHFNQISLFALVTLAQTYCAAINTILEKQLHANDPDLEHELVETMYLVNRAMGVVSSYKDYYLNKSLGGSSAGAFCANFESWFESTGFALSPEGNLLKHGRLVARDKKNIPAAISTLEVTQQFIAPNIEPEVYVPGQHENMANEIHAAVDFGKKIEAMLAFFHYRLEPDNQNVSDGEWVNLLEFGLQSTPNKYSKHAAAFDGKNHEQRMAYLCLRHLFGPNYQIIDFTKIHIIDEKIDPIRMLELHLNLAYQEDSVYLKDCIFEDALQFFDDYQRPMILLKNQLITDFDHILATHQEAPSPALTSMILARNTLNDNPKPTLKDFTDFTASIQAATQPQAGLSQGLRFSLKDYLYEAWNKIREFLGYQITRTEKTATLAMQLTSMRYMTKAQESELTRNSRSDPRPA